MNLPRRLRATTLGDVFALLYRARASGVLALREVGRAAGRTHEVHLRDGRVVGVGDDGARAGLAEGSAAHSRLASLYSLADAELSFHVARAAPRACVPLDPAAVFHGRPRGRDRGARAAPPPSSPHHDALARLGLPPVATLSEVHRAFKTLALRFHPDRHPGADGDQRRALCEQFGEVVRAYREIVA